MARRTVALGSELITPTKLWLELARFGISGNHETASINNYAEGLKSSSVPILFIGGSKDFLMPPDSVCAASEYPDNLGERVCKIMGKETGCDEDYGHVDLLVGKNVEKEVFPAIDEWLESHDHLSVGKRDSHSTKDPDGSLDVKLA